MPAAQAAEQGHEQRRRHKFRDPVPQEQGAIDASSKEPPRIEPRYYRGSELDERPAVVEFFSLDGYPVSPQKEGKAVIRLWINESGAVDRLEIEQSTLPAEMEAYLLASRDGLRFLPGRKDLTAVKSIVRYEFNLSRGIAGVN